MAYGTDCYAPSAPRPWSPGSVIAAALCIGALLGAVLSLSSQPTPQALYAPAATAQRTATVAAPTLQPRQPPVIQQAAMINNAAVYPEVEEAGQPSSSPSVASSSPLEWALLAGFAAALISGAMAFLSRPRPSRLAPICMMAASGARDYAGDMKSLSPLRDLVLARVAAAEEKTTGGLVLPDTLQSKPTSGDVIAVGPAVTALKKGDCVLYSKFGVALTELEIGGHPHILIREADVIGLMPRSPANAKDIPELKPLLDKVLVRKDVEAQNKPSGLIMQSADEDQKYITGEVVAAGPGAKDLAGEFHPTTVQPGQRVLFSKYAGDKLPTPSGPEYFSLVESELLGIL